jgi:hypothetical protein
MSVSLEHTFTYFPMVSSKTIQGIGELSSKHLDT